MLYDSLKVAKTRFNFNITSYFKAGQESFQPTATSYEIYAPYQIRFPYEISLN